LLSKIKILSIIYIEVWYNTKQGSVPTLLFVTKYCLKKMKKKITLIIALAIVFTTIYVPSFAQQLEEEPVSVSSNCLEETVSIAFNASAEIPDDSKSYIVFFDENGKLIDLECNSWSDVEGKTTLIDVAEHTDYASCKILLLSSEYAPLDNYDVQTFNFANLHTIVTIEAEDPDCETKGHTEHKYCSVCNKVFIQQEEIDSLGHNLVGGTCTRCGYTPVTGLSLNKTSQTIHTADDLQLDATISPSNATNKKVTWTSSNTSVATVNENGLVSAHAAGSVTITAKAEDKTATCSITVKNVMVVVNTETSTSSRRNGWFMDVSEGVDETHQSTEHLISSIAENSTQQEKVETTIEVQDVIVIDNGDELKVLSPVLGPLSQEDEVKLEAYKKEQYSKAALNKELPLTSALSVGTTKDIYDDENDKRSMECMYIGDHCTVWKCTTDTDTIQITPEIAEEIGESFDSNYSKVTDSFGTWYDADKDGKLAIYCYDIGQEYDMGQTNNPIYSEGYIAGFFWSLDLFDENNKANGVSMTGYKYRNMNSDCIHIDTFPNMSNKNNVFGDPLGDVADCYSTLIHECQHLINFSYLVKGGVGSSYSDDMETYLNEAFSMAAEHMINGSESTKSRIKYFNTSGSYEPGTSLFCWDSSFEDTLSHYSNSYLFGQYIRTRYAQQTGTDGNTIFKEVLEQRSANKGGNTLSIISSKLDTTNADLVKDFWSAVYLKDKSGKYGFNGEAWAEAISPQIITITALNKTGIYNGGCKYYEGSSSPTIKTRVTVTIR